MLTQLATVTLAFGLLTTGGPQPIQWESDYGTALKQTRSDDQPLLVVLDNGKNEKTCTAATQLCEKQLKGESVELLRPYNLCHVDVNTKYGKKVAEVFKAKTFPFVAIIDKTGSVIIHSKSGQLTDKEWSKALVANKSGNRKAVVARSKTQKTWTVGYRGEAIPQEGVTNQVVIEGSYEGGEVIYNDPYNTVPADCPSCQRANSYCPTCQQQ